MALASKKDESLDLDRFFTSSPVFQETYNASIRVLKDVVPHLPREEGGELAQQLRRDAREIPTLIAGGAKEGRSEAIRRCHEMMVMLSHCRDLFGHSVNGHTCRHLIDIYFRSSRSLVREVKK